MLISKINGDDLTEQTRQLDSYLTLDSVRKEITALQQSADEIGQKHQMNSIGRKLIIV
jgi:hypothetical protein